ncbi:hypothetical protein P153DRAFT_334404 [Dothidotthia symphoricarpi CBS 119687]|uniref:Uncharacterized protein n=1 Tax=Dothidotthia symphoricarpi CBS 119687 TaxID=1392245 RepID=A0A6A6AM79_9PLEO|nr:uncharacterized protein P153DRAFT_334404 [Dothidotthia symphoricarpi CBS 119687]KAF2131987.1 hypothetical protein P153DRAFT_334404 [Dothidotthia symphoricarpi CBS 119687]
MAPIRRYLRITKHSVLEVRIYLDRPADAEAWLLKRDDPALPRVIQAIRPLVLPKLREENERAKGKGGGKSKKKGVKDVTADFVPDDFEVSIFLTELSSRHSVLTKKKIFKDKPRIQSNSGKLTNWLTTGTSDQPVIINEGTMEPLTIRDEEEETVIHLADIPESDAQLQQSARSTRNSRREATSNQDHADDSDDSNLFVSGSTTKTRKANGRSDNADEEVDEGLQDDKKKLGLNTSYDGFSIYGRILCLVVKRRGVRTQAGVSVVPASSQAMLENWVSTQAALEQVGGDEDNG